MCFLFGVWCSDVDNDVLKDSVFLCYAEYGFGVGVALFVGVWRGFLCMGFSS